jgi:hypothetical protein
LELISINKIFNSGDYYTATEVDDFLALKLNVTDYNDRFKGKYTSLANLQTAHPTSNDGDYAIVDTGSGTDALEYIWDSNEGWIKGNSPGAATTDALPEGSSNLYFQTARVLATVLTGISFVTGGVIVSTDTVLQAFGKIQKQINDLSTVYQAILTEVNFGAFINGLTSKSTPVDADQIGLMDSADSNKQKKLSWLNLKLTLLDYFNLKYVRILIADDAAKTPLTGTTSSTIIASYSIPANTIPSNCLLRLKCKFNKTGTAGTMAAWINNNNTSETAGAILANSVSSGTAANISMMFEKHPHVVGGNMKVMNVSGGFYTDTTVSSSYSTYTFDPTVTQTIYLWGKLNNSADTLNFEFLTIEIIKM